MAEERAAFQSHAGSIEAAAGGGPREGLQGFQSHAGSIEACLGLVSMLDPLSFNPTLVRLRRVRGGTEVNHGHESFNPTLVRLRLPHRGSSPPVPISISIPRWFD